MLTLILSIALGVLFVAVGAFHLRGSDAVATIAEHTGHSVRDYRLIGLSELAGGLGLMLGLAVGWIGVAAGVGLTALMIGAVLTHVRIGDGPRQWFPSAVLGALAALTTILLFVG